MRQIELLAPARDVSCGITAVNCGADAVYIGASHYGAREDAGNSVEDIAKLVEYAHKYWVRVYVTFNTILYDNEIPHARRLIRQLYQIGVDGLIIQDMGLLECDLPPIPIIASTQMHNDTPDKVAFLQNIGIRRVILARELSLKQIAAIRQAAPQVELEYFIHGALCVSYSGQCYMSYAVGGRSANRGECAQPCRKSYNLTDSEGNILQADQHLLSIRDLNLTDSLRELLQAGISSLKIEGRLKDETYVANVVGHYRTQLDPLLSKLGLRKSSSGTCALDFTPDLNKTFNRGYTDYFLHDRDAAIGSPQTPKMTGERIGFVTDVRGNRITLATTITLHPGDGICFYDQNQKLQGTQINSVQGNTIIPDKTDGIAKGTVVYRNHDHEFLSQLKNTHSERRIACSFVLKEIQDALVLTVTDEDGIQAEHTLSGPFDSARKPEQALETIHRQLQKTGDTEFHCTSVTVELNQMYFLPISTLNELRRTVLEKLSAARLAARPVTNERIKPTDIPYPVDRLDYQGNILNQLAEAFYRRHGVTEIEPAAESGSVSLQERKVMTTKYCIKYEMNSCPKYQRANNLPETMFLNDKEGNRFKLHFNCARCEMEIYYIR